MYLFPDRDFIANITTVGGVRRRVITQLLPASTYRITITAVTRSGRSKEIASSAPATTLEVITKPDSPANLVLVNRSLHSAKVQWTAPSRVAEGAVVHGYRLKYSVINNLGDQSVVGSVITQPITNETVSSLEGLILGTKYITSVKVGSFM